MFCGKAGFLLAISLVLILQDIRRQSAEALPVPNGVKFVGVGYSILEGNPEGGDLGTGGVDPGIKITRHVFKFTYEQGKISDDEQYRIPDEVVYEPRNSAFTTSSLTTFYGTKSYASKLSAQVDVSGGYEGVMASVQFAASARYERVSEETNERGSVFLSNETITNLGRARYQTNLASTAHYLLDEGFVADACRLPAAYSEDDYMGFLDDWGTHIITTVDLGIREGENFESTRSSFVNYAAQEVGGSLSVGGGYGGFSASLSVDMDSFSSSMSSSAQFGSSSSKYTVGSESLNEPIKLGLISMPDVFDPDFWTQLDSYISGGHCSSAFQRESVKANMATALRGYADWKEIESSTNPEITIPMTWPEGEYSLPKGVRGCPNTEFRWSEGHVIQATSENGENMWSDLNLDLAGWWFPPSFTKQEFCTKPIETVSQHSKWEFQPGSYCVFQHRSKCPKGFESGHLHWGRSSTQEAAEIMNEADGVLPQGTYGLETDINTCCRRDGYAGNPIFLPTDDRFVLLARYDQCQMVHGMNVQKEWLYWQTDTGSSQSSEHPFNGVYNGGRGIRLVYCYYYTGDLDRDEEDVGRRLQAFTNDFVRRVNAYS